MTTEEGNKIIAQQQKEINELKTEITNLEYEINYRTREMNERQHQINLLREGLTEMINLTEIFDRMWFTKESLAKIDKAKKALKQTDGI